MSSLNLEISEKEYIIKLDKKNYSLSALEKVVTRIQHDTNSLFFNEQDFGSDIRSRINDHYSDNFDHLSEK